MKKNILLTVLSLVFINQSHAAVQTPAIKAADVSVLDLAKFTLVTREIILTTITPEHLNQPTSEVLEKILGTFTPRQIAMMFEISIKNIMQEEYTKDIPNQRPIPWTWDTKSDFSVFITVNPFIIDIFDYLIRLQKYLKCSPECCILTLVYIQRFISKNQDLSLVRIVTYHKIFFTALLLAMKFLGDNTYSEVRTRAVAGIKSMNEQADLHQCNLLQLTFLSKIDYNLYVSPKDWRQALEDFLRISVTDEFLNNRDPKFDALDSSATH